MFLPKGLKYKFFLFEKQKLFKLLYLYDVSGHHKKIQNLGQLNKKNRKKVCRKSGSPVTCISLPTHTSPDVM